MSPYLRWLSAVVLFSLVAGAGAATPQSQSMQHRSTANRSANAGAVKELPVCNLPEPLREKNYKGGSCVHASTESDFNWLHEYPLAKWWRQTYSGGESYNGLTSKLTKNKIQFYATANGDVNVLERCTAERRMATIFYYPSHSINFCGFQDGYAYLLDNNRTGEWIRVPRETFLRNWKGYGGVAVVPLIGSPSPPLPWRPTKSAEGSLLSAFAETFSGPSDRNSLDATTRAALAEQARRRQAHKPSRSWLGIAL